VNEAAPVKDAAPAKSSPKPVFAKAASKAPVVAPSKPSLPLPPARPVRPVPAAPQMRSRPGASPVAVPLGPPLDAKFLDAQRKLLLDERSVLLGQADRLESEAASLMEDLDPGDVQFDDESGEGDSIVVERDRDRALSAQARQTITDIDAALSRIDDGSYGYSLTSGRPIPRERLKAIPYATELVEEKVGGLGTRR
jgi:RNA polymerase-binding transcription factor DksA